MVEIILSLHRSIFSESIPHVLGKRFTRKSFFLSFPRRRESSISKTSWTPDLAGVTIYLTSQESFPLETA
jgi:hypothetical protein